MTLSQIPGRRTLLSDHKKTSLSKIIIIEDQRASSKIKKRSKEALARISKRPRTPVRTEWTMRKWSPMMHMFQTLASKTKGINLARKVPSEPCPVSRMVREISDQVPATKPT